MGESKPANAADPTANADPTEENEPGADGNTPAPELDPKALQATNERLVAEAKKVKARAQQAEKELATQKAKEAEQNGKYKELAEDREKRLTDLQKRVMRKDIDLALRDAASAAGFQKPADILRFVDSGMLHYDEDSGEVTGAAEAVAKAKLDWPQLFQKPNSTVINPKTPNGVPVKSKITAQDYLKLSPEQRKLAKMKVLSPNK